MHPEAGTAANTCSSRRNGWLPQSDAVSQRCDLQEAWCEPRFLSAPFFSTPFFEYPFLEYPLPTTRFTAGQC